jgi:hypothetical protein
MKLLHLFVLLLLLGCLMPAQAQLELEREGDRYVLVAKPSEQRLLSFPAINFIQAEGKNGEKLKNSSSVITATGEIEHDWIVRGILYTTSDSVGFVLGFHKVKDENTVLFSLALSDTTARTYEFCFFYADSVGTIEGIRMSGTKNRKKKLRNNFKLAYNTIPKDDKKFVSTTVNGFYTTTKRAVVLQHIAATVYNFRQPILFCIKTKGTPLKGKLLFNMAGGL